MIAKIDNVRFIIKAIDKKEGGWGYIWNECPICALMFLKLIQKKEKFLKNGKGTLVERK